MRQAGQSEDSHSDTNQVSTHELKAVDQPSIITYVIKKIEKLSQALYVLTTHLPPEEPFRHNVRTRALALMDNLYGLQSEANDTLTGLENLVHQQLNELLAVLRVGVRSRLLSDMNFAVLETEVKALQALVGQPAAATNMTITNDFFKASAAPRFKNDTDSHGHTSVVNKFSAAGAVDQNSVPAAAASEKAEASSSRLRARRRHGRNHSKRQRAILALFKNSNEITINDVQEVVEGCSQKTMQRELKAMVSDGVLEKRGKRRWSSYVLGRGVDLDQELGL